MLLLDEPTNDLDFAGLELLERFLDRHRGGLVAASHDRTFLERMTKILEFEAETRNVREYAGGWSAFEAERRRSLERHLGAYRHYATERDRIQEQARTMRRWEERGYGQGRKKKKSKDVGKRFEKKLGPARTRRQAMVIVAIGARAHADATRGGRRRAARASSRRAARVPARPGRSRGSERRPARGQREKWCGKDDTAEGAAR